MDSLDDLQLLSKDELIDLLAGQAEAGVKITFPGKATSRRILRRVRPRVQRTVAKYGAGREQDRARNLLIEGDNLQALTTLYRERGHVDLILTDPPYNTGGDWRYNDKWDKDPNDPGIGELVNGDDLARHTKWMKFMYPRLLLMKQMLKPGGVLAICIDHRELFHLGQMLDELFGEQNRLAIINWEKMTAPKNHDMGVSTATEYVLVYARDKERSKTAKLPHSEATAGTYKDRDDDPKGAWTSTDATLMGGPSHPGQVYGIQNPFTGRVHYPQVGRCWRNERAKMRAAAEAWGAEYEDRELNDGLVNALVIKGVTNPLAEDVMIDPAVLAARTAALEVRQGPWPRFYWNNNRARETGAGELRYKTYASEVAGGVVPTTFWADDDMETLPLGSTSWEHEQSGTTDIGVRELNAVVGRGHGFDTVKPLKLFRKIVQLWCPPEGVVLDPFVGSGTTAHAILSLNKDQGLNRRFIVIEQGHPEKGDSYARTLTADRLKRVVEGDWANGKGSGTGGGFEFRTLTKQVDATALLAMERDEMVDTVVASYFDSSKRRGPTLERLSEPPYQYLVAKNSEGEGFYLVWDGTGENIDLTEEVYEACVAEGEKADLQAIYHIYSRFNLFTTPGVHWYQIPDRILADFGLDVRTESYNDEDH